MRKRLAIRLLRWAWKLDTQAVWNRMEPVVMAVHRDDKAIEEAAYRFVWR